jgi:[ribosomal protein S5]-alanine N-acetyltransferase
MEAILRPLRESDITNLAKYANNPKIAANLTNAFPHPYTEEAATGFIKMAMGHSPFRIMAITMQDELIGCIGIHPQEDIMSKNAELGYWLAEPYWGQGIMTKMVKEMVKYGFETFDIHRIYARPFGNNLGSQKVLEHAGFTLEARLKETIFKLGRMEDELIYAVRTKK